MVATLAIGVDLLLSLVQRRLTPRALLAPKRSRTSGPTSVVGGADLGAATGDAR